MKVKTLLNFINEQSGSDYDKIFYDPLGPYGTGEDQSSVDLQKKNKKIKPFEPFRKDWSYAMPKKEDNDDQTVLYHAVEVENLESVLDDGLHGEIYLTKTPREAAKYHPIVLKINVTGRKLKVKDEGFVVKDVPSDQIEEL